MNWKKTLVICLVILLTGVAATTLIFTTEPTAEQGGATKQTAMLVDVIEVNRGNFAPVLEVTGTVRPSQEVSLSPRVSGEVIGMSSSFTPGGFVEKGETLLQIDRSDYEIALLRQQSMLRQAESDLKIEMGLQQVAEREYQLLQDTLTEENKALLLREPQLSAARSDVETARANVRQAELDLERTSIKAPFNAHIVNRNINIGSQLSPGQDLGWLVGDDVYWVEASVPISNLKWLSFSDEVNSTGSPVSLRNRTAWDEGVTRSGRLFRLIGALQNQTRMARVLVEVDDPLSRKPEHRDLPKLMVGEFLQTGIQGRTLEDVVRVSRDYVRSDDTIWVMEDKTLRIKPVTILFKDPEYAYISEGLDDGAMVVTTNLSTVVDGAGLRLEGEPENSAD